MNNANRPTIGVTLDRNDRAESYASYFNYAQAVILAGGLPMLLPYKVPLDLVPMYVDRLDGILFTGGNDLDPSVYGESFHIEAAPIDPDRQKFEFALLDEVERRRMPALGVCLGSQLMNVHRGGSLHQFLPDVAQENSIEHRKIGDTPTRHKVRVDINTQLGMAIGGPILSVNTYHKQAINRLGRNLKIIATSPDGIIEAFEDDNLPLYVAVQWHPERLTDEPAHLAPFKLLIDVCNREHSHDR